MSIWRNSFCSSSYSKYMIYLLRRLSEKTGSLFFIIILTKKEEAVALKLNARQKAFCEYYVASGNATESAIKAGYKERYARQNTPKLLRNTTLVGYIKELREKTKTSRIMTAIERREFLTEVIKNGKEKIQDRLKALDILNKMDGEYIEKMQLSGQLNTNPFSGLTIEELRALAGGKSG